MYETKHERLFLNIVLIGMPGCGKSSIGKALSDLSGMQLIDIDEEVERSSGMSVIQIFEDYGEDYFRRLETEETANAGRLSGIIIATGGGVVMKAGNFPALAERGRIYYLQNSVSKLAFCGRPLSKDRDTLLKLYEERDPLYRDFSDCVVQEGKVSSVAEFIRDDFERFRNKNN